MKNSKNFWVWIGVVIVVLIIIAWAWALYTPNKPVVAGPTPVVAPQGQLTPQFPKALVLDSSAAVNSSYSLNFSTSTNQYTAIYSSSSTVKSLFASYQTYFKSNGWTVTGSLASSPSFNAISATDAAGDQVEVAIATQKSGSQVTVTEVVQ